MREWGRARLVACGGWVRSRDAGWLRATCSAVGGFGGWGRSGLVVFPTCRRLRGSLLRHSVLRGLGPQGVDPQGLPLTVFAPGSVPGWRRLVGDRSCDGGASTRRGGHGVRAAPTG